MVAPGNATPTTHRPGQQRHHGERRGDRADRGNRARRAGAGRGRASVTTASATIPIPHPIATRGCSRSAISAWRQRQPQQIDARRGRKQREIPAVRARSRRRTRCGRPSGRGATRPTVATTQSAPIAAVMRRVSDAQIRDLTRAGMTGEPRQQRGLHALEQEDRNARDHQAGEELAGRRVVLLRARAAAPGSDRC